MLDCASVVPTGAFREYLGEYRWTIDLDHPISRVRA